MTDYSLFILPAKEKILLLKLRFKKNVPKEYFGDYFTKFRKLDLIKAKSYTYVNGFATPEDSYLLSSTYWEYISYRREQYFKGKLPVIISICALMKSYDIGVDDIILWCMRQLGL